MSEWETREASFEKSQEIGEARRFKSLARRNRLVGLWAAEKRGLTGADAEAYADRLVDEQVGRDDDEALAVWLESQFAALDPPLSPHRIRRRIAELTAKAGRDVFQGR